MIRRVPGVAVIAVVAGCRFEPGVLAEGDAAIVEDTRRADSGDATDAPVTPVTPFCDVGDTTLVACYEFEGTTDDASPNALHPVAANVTFVPGRVGMGVLLTPSSAMDVPDAPVLDISYVTIEAWIRPNEQPTTRSGILDSDGQYSMYLYPGGVLRCDGFDVMAAIQTATWTHVACTYDGTRRVYVDGVLVAQDGGGGGPLQTGGTTGMSLGKDNPPDAGDRLIGTLDQLRLFNVARTAEQICAAAGRTNC